MPHDVIVTPDGTVWYDSFAEQILGKLDPATGKTVEYTIADVETGVAQGIVGVAGRSGRQFVDRHGVSGRRRAVRSEVPETFEMFPVPPERNKDYVQTTEVEPTHANVDGKVWIEDSGTYSIYRLTSRPASMRCSSRSRSPARTSTTSPAMPQNNVYFTVFGRGDIGRIDAKTGAVRRGRRRRPIRRRAAARWTQHGKFWFGEFRGDKFGMFDPATQTFREWTPPTPGYFPYDVVADRNGDVWAGSMQADRVDRLDPRTGTFTEYLLPRQTNMRRSFVDDRTTPVSFWVGSNHGASIVKLEPQD